MRCVQDAVQFYGRIYNPSSDIHFIGHIVRYRVAPSDRQDGASFIVLFTGQFANVYRKIQIAICFSYTGLLAQLVRAPC